MNRYSAESGPMKLKRHYFQDANGQHWWIVLDGSSIARAADLGVNLAGLTLETFGTDVVGNLQLVADVLVALALSATPQRFILDIGTVIRGVEALAKAMDERFPGRHFFWACQKTRRAAF